jgi:hypothetical protein
MGFVSHYTGTRDQCWQTPPAFFRTLHERFQFTLDGAALPHTALLPRYSTKDAPLSWEGERVFCNPPWSDMKPFVELAARAVLAVLLVPARCNSRWFNRALELGARAEFFQGRPHFHKDGIAPKSGCPFDCVLLIFKGGVSEQVES